MEILILCYECSNLSSRELSPERNVCQFNLFTRDVTTNIFPTRLCKHSVIFVDVLFLLSYGFTSFLCFGIQ